MDGWRKGKSSSELWRTSAAAITKGSGALGNQYEGMFSLCGAC